MPLATPLSVRTPALLLLLAACAGPADPREAWLVDALVDDNRIWLTRDRTLLAQKYAAMAADPYDFFRATAGVWLRDQARAGTERPTTRFLRTPGALEILLAGDPHPENFGAFLPGLNADNAVALDLNDLDGAAWGPWLWDLRRAATGVRMAVEPVDACDAACADAAVDALARAYADELLTLQAGGAPVDASDLVAHGRIVGDLLDKAEEEGRRREREADETDPGEEGLVLVREPLDEDGRGHLSLTPVEQRLVDGLMASFAAHPAAPPGFRVRDATRRYGRGVASLPALRFVVLYDTGDPGDADDRLLQTREVVDPPAVPGLARPVEGLFASQSARIEGAPRALWARPDNDPRLAGLIVEGLTFKTLTWSGYSEGLDHGDIQEALDDGDVDAADVAGMAALMGRLLAGAHARAPTAAGPAGLDVLVADLDGDVDGLAEELVTASAADLARSLADHGRLLRALDRLGPWLGADALGPFGEIP